MIRVVLKVNLGGNTSEVSPGTRIYEVLKDNKAIAARMNGRLVDLATEIQADCEISPVYFDSPEGRSIFWHSTSHLMAQAVKQLYPDAKLAIGPAIEDGFYYDFDMAHPLSDVDLAAIEAKMTELVKQEIPIRHKLIPRAELIAEYEREGNNYKLELLNGIPDPEISVYEQAEFRDLCRGPHISNTKLIRAIKLLSVAGAYWRGDEKSKMLQRIYGVSYPSRSLLEEHLARIEEAKKRDHRKLAPALDLFSLHEEAGAGLVFWHPKGATVRRLIEQYWVQEHLAAGYQLVVTPHIARSGLWRTSGHYDFFRDNMFTLPVENEEYVLKPMNCPGHIIIYRSGVRSYRDLPIRYGEWGTVYRNERSGVLHGAMRVRGLTQDDAHIFCSEDQMQEEVYNVVQLSRKILGTFGFTEFAVDLSVRDPAKKEQYMGEDRSWELAEASLAAALQRAGLEYTRAEGEAAFYGPKIDIKLFDSLGRRWQCPTIQFDFNEAERFNIYYMGADGQHHRAYLVHRTILGSVERFVAILVEHHAGAFPVWLAPVQAVVLTVTEAQSAYAQGVFEQLHAAGIRATIDIRNEKIGYKIGEAERDKIPYMLVIGGKEQESGMVALRKRGQGNLGGAPLDAVVNQIKEDDATRRQTTA
jgi:threonyl-tRNA synthetase